MTDYKAVVYDLLDWLENEEIHCGMAKYFPDPETMEFPEKPYPELVGEERAFRKAKMQLYKLIREGRSEDE